MGGDGSLAALLGLRAEAVAALVAELAARQVTVAAAESLTGGLLTAVLTEVAGSSVVVRGGLVVYATDLKSSLAGVDPDLLAARGAVDARVARELAEGARRRCGATVGLGLTGVAGPTRQDGAPVGTFHVALSGPDGCTRHSAEPETDSTAGRSGVRAAAVRAAVDLLTRYAAASGTALPDPRTARGVA